MHSFSYTACNLNFGRFYGKYLRFGIQIHHLRPASELDALSEIDAESYLVPLCTNFDTVVYRIPIGTNLLSEFVNLIPTKITQ